MGSEHWHGEEALQALCRTLHFTLRCGCRVAWEHVHGHCGHPWNELADACAGWAASGRTGSSLPNLSAWRALLLRPPTLAWAWLAAAPAALREALPHGPRGRALDGRLDGPPPAMLRDVGGCRPRVARSAPVVDVEHDMELDIK
eukprot:7526880-Lingulodinium_polyedra.AAC.1